MAAVVEEEAEAEDEQGAGVLKLDCGSFLVRQTESMSIYDDFEEIDDYESSVEGIDDMLCTELKGGSELCFGGDEETAFWVHGQCERGRGHTTVSVAAMSADSEILFACGGSPDASPSVDCSVCEMPVGEDEETQQCTFPFRAEARFGILTIPQNSEGKCTLICDMPTTNE